MAGIAGPNGSPLDVKGLRADTPSCANVLHFNHAGASLMSAPVVETPIAQGRRQAEIVQRGAFHPNHA